MTPTQALDPKNFHVFVAWVEKANTQGLPVGKPGDPYGCPLVKYVKDTTGEDIMVGLAKFDGPGSWHVKDSGKRDDYQELTGPFEETRKYVDGLFTVDSSLLLEKARQLSAPEGEKAA